MERKIAIRMVSVFASAIWIAFYGLDVKKPYPRIVINAFDEPSTRFVCYAAMFAIASIDAYAALAYSVALLFLHIDYINLT